MPSSLISIFRYPKKILFVIFPLFTLLFVLPLIWFLLLRYSGSFALLELHESLRINPIYKTVFSTIFGGSAGLVSNSLGEKVKTASVAIPVKVEPGIYGGRGGLMAYGTINSIGTINGDKADTLVARVDMDFGKQYEFILRFTETRYLTLYKSGSESDTGREVYTDEVPYAKDSLEKGDRVIVIYDNEINKNLSTIVKL